MVDETNLLQYSMWQGDTMGSNGESPYILNQTLRVLCLALRCLCVQIHRRVSLTSFCVPA